jgi:hypothetical protein
MVLVGVQKYFRKLSTSPSTNRKYLGCNIVFSTSSSPFHPHTSKDKSCVKSACSTCAFLLLTSIFAGCERSQPILIHRQSQTMQMFLWSSVRLPSARQLHRRHQPFTTWPPRPIVNKISGIFSVARSPPWLQEKTQKIPYYCHCPKTHRVAARHSLRRQVMDDLGRHPLST